MQADLQRKVEERNRLLAEYKVRGSCSFLIRLVGACFDQPEDHSLVLGGLSRSALQPYFAPPFLLLMPPFSCVAERAGPEGSSLAPAPGQDGGDAAATLRGQLPTGTDSLPPRTLPLAWHSWPCSLPTCALPLQADLERELEHREALLAQCMKKDAEEVCEAERWGQVLKGSWHKWCPCSMLYRAPCGVQRRW